MSNKLTSFVMFIIGTTVGTFVTWCYTKKKYERIAQEEINSVKEVFSKKDAKKSNLISSDNYISEDNSYEDLLQTQGYKDYSNVDICETKKEETNNMDKPYVISPDEFGEYDEYEKISLTYYADGTLADDNDEILEDVENSVGFDSLNHFGDYEDDSVFVRNDSRECDYEILLDQREYSEVVKSKPYLI